MGDTYTLDHSSVAYLKHPKHSYQYTNFDGMDPRAYGATDLDPASRTRPVPACMSLETEGNSGPTLRSPRNDARPGSSLPEATSLMRPTSMGNASAGNHSNVVTRSYRPSKQPCTPLPESFRQLVPGTRSDTIVTTPFKPGLEHHAPFPSADDASERLYVNFQARAKPRLFFKVGKVFRVLWSEPAGDASSAVSGSSYTTGRFGGTVYSKVRRFVVVRQSDTYCAALPITTYGGRGVSKIGVKKSEHGIIYSGRTPPTPLPAEEPERNELPMQPTPIRVLTDNLTEKLDSMARVDYGKIYTIQHNIKVQSFGQVHQHSMFPLISQFQIVWTAMNPTLSIHTPHNTTQEATMLEAAPKVATLSSEHARSDTARYAIVPSALITINQEDDPPKTPCRSTSEPDLTKSKIARLLAQGYTAEQVINALLGNGEDEGTGN